MKGGYNPKSESPFSLGIGGGYGVVKDEKNGGGENGNGGEELGDICRSYPGEEEFVTRGGLCEKRCKETGGIWGDEPDKGGDNCECPGGKRLGVDGTCNIAG